MFGFAPYSAAPFSGLANAGVTVALTGVLAGGAVGTVTVAERQIALTGNSATGNVGTVSLGARTIALTGVFASGDVGLLWARSFY